MSEKEDLLARVEKASKKIKEYEGTLINFVRGNEMDFRPCMNGKWYPEEDGVYLTLRCGLGGIYKMVNEWKNKHWQCEVADGSTTIAYSRNRLTELEDYINKECK